MQSPLYTNPEISQFHPNLSATPFPIINQALMSDRSTPATGRRMPYDSTTPASRQAVKFLTAATIASVFLVSSGLTLTGTVLLLILSTPILVLFSPVLVPAATALVLVGAGLVFSGSCVAAGGAAVWWMYRYVTGKQPAGAEQVDYARGKIAETAREMKEKATELGQNVQAKGQRIIAQEGS